MRTFRSVVRPLVLLGAFLVLASLQTSDVLAQGTDTDGDGLADVGDPDDDNDGVGDAADSAPLDPHACRDIDSDTCDDCVIGTDGFGPQADNLPAHDGPDTDGDGLCDAGDSGGPNGQDTDGDGLQNPTDPDDDNDGVGDAADNAPLDPHLCQDLDDDTCDDCAIGTDGFGPQADNLPAHDGPDTDGDGLCDAGDSGGPNGQDTDGDGVENPTDPDDDNDGVGDAADNDPLDPHVCRDIDNDTCDDCAIGTDGFGPLADYLPAHDGPDTDGDGLCDAGDSGGPNDHDTDGDGVENPADPDDDNDGVGDAADNDPLDPHVCQDLDDDTCDDCAIGTDGLGPLVDSLPANDGHDSDGDGACDAGDCAPFDLHAHPGAPEINDGDDDQCAGDSGHGLIDEISGDVLFPNREEFCWTAQLNATQYRVLRSTTVEGGGCVVYLSTGSCVQDLSVPDAGQVQLYVVQAASPHTGSWGSDSSGNERFPACP